jgi:Protein of unknown function (DUF3011)
MPQPSPSLGVLPNKGPSPISGSTVFEGLEAVAMKRLLFALSGLVFAVLFLPMLSTSPSSALSAMPGPRAYKVYCASDDFYRHFCSVNAYGGVEIIRQRSESACIYGRTWGVAGNSIWVDRGCRADFAVGTGEYYGGGDYNGARTFYCASDDFNFHGCRVDTCGGVRLIRQRSDSPCVFGRTWGYDERGVWVDRGCRADFVVGYRRDHYDRDDRDYDRGDWRH